MREELKQLRHLPQATAARPQGAFFGIFICVKYECKKTLP
jgi:hypothetical protein